MSATCGTCRHWNPRNPRADREMVAHGTALCDLGTTWTYLSAHHSCPRHAEATAEVIAGRQAWLATLERKHADLRP